MENLNLLYNSDNIINILELCFENFRNDEKIQDLLVPVDRNYILDIIKNLTVDVKYLIMKQIDALKINPYSNMNIDSTIIKKMIINDLNNLNTTNINNESSQKRKIFDEYIDLSRNIQECNTYAKKIKLNSDSNDNSDDDLNNQSDDNLECNEICLPIKKKCHNIQYSQKCHMCLDWLHSGEDIIKYVDPESEYDGFYIHKNCL